MIARGAVMGRRVIEFDACDSSAVGCPDAAPPLRFCLFSPAAFGITFLVDYTPYLVVLGVLIFAAASFFFALAESALFALSKWQLEQLAERTPGQGAIVSGLLKRPAELLATIVLGNTVANAAIV